jgi:hypothetical protein
LIGYGLSRTKLRTGEVIYNDLEKDIELFQAVQDENSVKDKALSLGASIARIWRSTKSTRVDGIPAEGQIQVMDVFLTICTLMAI